jgi:hypothetical protein
MAKRKYRVNAPTPVLDHEPGETFEADLDPTLEARLLAGGALVVDAAPAAAQKAAPEKPVKPDPSE